MTLKLGMEDEPLRNLINPCACIDEADHRFSSRHRGDQKLNLVSSGSISSNQVNSSIYLVGKHPKGTTIQHETAGNLNQPAGPDFNKPDNKNWCVGTGCATRSGICSGPSFPGNLEKILIQVEIG